MENLARIAASRKTGAEPLTADGKPIGLTAADSATLDRES
jgi:hypothetical protein